MREKWHCRHSGCWRGLFEQGEIRNQICCVECVSKEFCRDTGEWPGCHPETCGKSYLPKSDAKYRRRYEFRGRKKR